ncbi:MAG: DUF6132 family protein [Chloroherpetonaceae bacterium]|nr:DUF6132 family protein [Chloroherpetonaceae bacterium]MDW8436601.1 DUF6132 family protein [Chloroherpetonaceae bacterium]
MNVNWLKLIAFVALGAAGGVAYYHFIGCVSGACPIASNPFASVAWGALMGATLGWESKKQNQRKR